MGTNGILILIVIISIAFFPCLSAYYSWKLGRDYMKKKRKIADFIEESAEKQIKSKDGPE